MPRHVRLFAGFIARSFPRKLVLAVGLASSAVGAQNTKSRPVPINGAISMAPRPAKALIDEALLAAKDAHKNVLVDFGASWCGWCHRFDAFLADPSAGKIMLDNFVVVHLTVQEVPEKRILENDGGGALMQQMGGQGLPWFYILDPAGKKLGDANIMPGHSNIGHPDKPEEIVAFDLLLKNTAPHMTDAQRKQIFDYLTRVAKGIAAQQ